MNILIPLVVVAALFLLGSLGGAASGLGLVFGVVIPYIAIALFVIGLIRRVMGWANSAVPFRIPTTCGQHQALDWIKPQKLETPHSTLFVIGRMALEVLFFRSLLRNTTSELRGGRLAYATSIWLWLAAMAMHWSFLLILLRHLRFFTNPTPWCITLLQETDGFFEVGLPVIYVTSVLFLAGLGYLLLRRFANPQLRYISLANDYFPLFLLLGIGISGVCLRHLTKTDIVGVKELAVGLVSFSPGVPPAGISWLFYGHLFLVCVLLAYFPLSKLTHMAGVFLSPTRNMANTNRSERHVNPWDYPVKVHPYEEYEDELRDKMKAAGLPVEKE